MKRIVLILVCTGLFLTGLFAQLKVETNGNVGIQIGSSTPISSFAIGDVGNTSAKAYVSGNVVGLHGVSNGTGSIPGINWTYGLVGEANLFNNMHIAVSGQSFSSTPKNSYRAFGVLGMAGNSTSGYNYGVFGTTYGSQNGAGIVGTTGNNRDVNISTGLFAGYFVGNVRVTGTINGVTVGNSDIRYKQDIVDLGDLAVEKSNKSTSGILSTVMKMTPIQYNLKQQYIESAGDSAVVRQTLYDEKSQLFQKKHYGLIAQDLQKIYPDLVYEEDNGYLTINYTGLIPLLIQSIKELNAKIEVLEGGENISMPKSAPAIKGGNPELNSQTAALYQNAPNPFSQSTRITYYIPDEVSQALLCIYDMQGKQLKQITLSVRGEGSETIYGSELSAGIYLYALLADGKEVDVKRMILTE